jgi:uncharacterized protein YkwD
VNAGVVVTMAAGNDSEELTSTNIQSPASYGGQINGAITVGAIDSSLGKSSYSNYGPTYVEIGSPGTGILSTYLGSAYATLSGTSMATPIVSGAAGLAIGLLRGRGTTPTPALIEQLIKDGSVHDSALSTYYQNGNRLNIRGLAQTIDTRYPATPAPEPPPPVDPCGTMTGIACQVFQAVNAQRTRAGVTSLKPLARCSSTEQSHTDDMAAGPYFSHTSPTRGAFPDRARAAGLTGDAAENLGFGYTSVTALVNAWMAYAQSHANLLNPGFQSSGVGYSTDSDGHIFYGQCLSSQPGD